MKHCISEKSLNAYYDGELPEDERASVAAHVAECPICASQLAFNENISRLAREAAVRVPSSSTLARYHDYARQARPTRNWGLGIALNAAAAILLIIGTMTSTTMTQQDSPDEALTQTWEIFALGVNDIDIIDEDEDEDFQIAQWTNYELLSEDYDD